MATTSLWKVDKRLDHVIDYATDEEKTKNEGSNFDSIEKLLTYATNPAKTEKLFYTTGINCKVDNAVKEMQFIKKLYGKEKGILAFHGYQSFKEGEVTPEMAHEIGVRLAEEMWGDRFQVVVSTHLNTDNIHKQSSAALFHLKMDTSIIVILVIQHYFEKHQTKYVRNMD